MRALCAVSPSALLSLHCPLLAIRARNSSSVAALPRAFTKLQAAGTLLQCQGAGVTRRTVLSVVAMAAADAAADVANTATVAVVDTPIEVFVKAAVGQPDKLGDCK